jgi:hypothetical protein
MAGTFHGAELTVEIAFGADPLTASPTWTDVSADVTDIEIGRRGRRYFDDPVGNTIADFNLNNFNGDYTPSNTAGAYYPDVRPMNPIRVTAEYDAVTYPLYRGFVTGWENRYPAGAAGKALTVAHCTDITFMFHQADAPIINTRALAATATDPLAWWRFDTTADETGNGHTLTWNGSPTVGGAAGAWESDGATNIDGVNDFATVASEADLELDSDMSIEFWVNPDDVTGSDQCIISCRQTTALNESTGPLYEVFYNPTNNSFVFYPTSGPGSGFVFGSGSLHGVWHHIVITIDWTSTSRTIRAYKNGVLAASSTVTHLPITPAPTVNIGRRAILNDLHFDGKISEMAVWDRVLTAAEVNTLYTASAEGYVDQLTSERIGFILDEYGYTLQDLGTGLAEISGLDTPTEGSVMEQIRHAETTEPGVFFIAGDGTATFHNRTHRAVNHSTPTAIFDGTGDNDLTYHLLATAVDLWLLNNEIVVTPGTDPAWTATDPDSIALYGRQTLSKTIYPTDPDDARGHANHLLGRFSDPHTRIDRLEIRMGKQAELWPIILGAEIGNRYTLKKLLAGDDIETDVYLESIAHHISADKTWKVELVLSPADDERLWILGKTGASELGATTYLGY